MGEYGGVEHEISIRDLGSVNKKAVGHEWMPVVELIKLQGNAVLVLELGVKEQGRIKLQP